MEIKILGSGCAKCNELDRVVKEAVEHLGVDAEVEHVTDFAQIMAYGVMSTPALVINGQVKVAGRVPKLDDVKSLIAGGPDTCGSGGSCCGGGGSDGGGSCCC
ncbi:MAG TPA: thioredoxin family protein [Coriobacteriia bacterium]|nr:thioredoxin family protein [Coriobacteriia bacterium]